MLTAAEIIQPNKKPRHFCRGSFIGGEGGIRTLDTLLTYTHFPGVLLQPLGHLSNKLFQISYVVAYLRAQTLIVLMAAGNRNEAITLKNNPENACWRIAVEYIAYTRHQTPTISEVSS